MRRRGITLIEIIVVLVIIGVLAAILLPAFRRPARFHAAIIPAQQFNQVPLQSVVAKLDQALQVSRAQQGKRPVKYLKKIVWEKEGLKYRRVTLNTQTAMSLKEVLAQLEQVAKIKISFGPGCGTCGSFHGPTTIKDTAAKVTNKRANKALHPTAYSFAPSFVPHFVAALPAAGELGRCVAAPALRVKQAVLRPLICRVVSRYLAASAPRWARLARSGAAFGFRVAEAN